MASGTTLLSYEMSWQLKLFELMTNSQQALDYPMACVYGEGLLLFLRIKDKVPKKDIPLQRGGNAEILSLQKYYRDILMAVLDRIGSTIDAVRNDPKYRRDGLVPTYDKRNS